MFDMYIKYTFVRSALLKKHTTMSSTQWRHSFANNVFYPKSANVVVLYSSSTLHSILDWLCAFDIDGE